VIDPRTSHLRPLGFAKVSIPVADVGRLIGKGGVGIKTLQAKLLETTEHASMLGIESRLSSPSLHLEVCVVNEAPESVVGPKHVATLTVVAAVWCSEAFTTTDFFEEKNASRILSRAFYAEVSAAVTVASGPLGKVSTRLPHLEQLPLKRYAYPGDKERNRIRRYQNEKHRLRALRVFRVRSAVELVLPSVAASQGAIGCQASASRKKSISRIDLWPLCSRLALGGMPFDPKARIPSEFTKRALKEEKTARRTQQLRALIEKKKAIRGTRSKPHRESRLEMR
jgi:hypothetical protein